VKRHVRLVITAASLILILTGMIVIIEGSKPIYRYDGSRAFQDVAVQMSFGPRTPGSEAHQKFNAWLTGELTKNGWQVETWESSDPQPIKNIIARRGSGQPWTVLGAHYDSRLQASADAEPVNRTQPVPGANDGASGVAVLLELARSLPPETSGEVWLVFFDAEDNGEIPGWEWIMGSRRFVADLLARSERKPDRAVIVDMVGDAELDLYYEGQSSEALQTEIWQTAKTAGYGDVFIPEKRYNILDDHVPFLEAGIPAVDIIDFDYPHWHRLSDTADKVSAASLQAVGDTLWHWLVGR